MSDWYSNAHEKFIETAEKYPQSLILPPDEIKIEQHSSIIETSVMPINYEEPADLPGINDVIDSVTNKQIPNQYAGKTSIDDVYKWLGDPREYKYRNLDLFKRSNPSPQEHNSYIGLKNVPSAIKFVIFVNCLANIGYLENTEENLQCFVYRLTGRTLKDSESMKESSPVKLLSTEYGKRTNITSKALWYIIYCICNNDNNGGATTDIKAKGSVYEKSTRLFMFDSVEQEWFTDKKNYEQTVNHQRADERIKVLMYLLFDVPIEKES